MTGGPGSARPGAGVAAASTPRAATGRTFRSLVLIPSYNSGDLVRATVVEAHRYWNPVWIVVDGSNDGSDQPLAALAASDPSIRVLRLPANQGKGAAVMHGLAAAERDGYTHVLVMDADGQHPAAMIPQFMRLAEADPTAMILGRPVFDASAPALRVKGRRVSNWWANLETLWSGLDDSLFGFRVYPVAALLAVMRSNRWMRRYDFDAEAAVRLAWRGVRPISVDAPCRYLSRDEGGISHFDYVRDNLLLSWMHLRLMAGFIVRLPMLIARRLRRVG